MVSTERLLAFAAFSAVLIAIPGPSVLFTVSRALMVGRRGALLTVVGNAIGASMQIVAVAAGIGAIVQRSVEIFTVVKLAGAGYLVFLGIQAIRHRRSLFDALQVAIPPSRGRRMFRDGFVVGLTNPKCIVFFVAVLPQFVDRSASAVPLQMLIVGAIFPAIAVVFDGTWAVVASAARAWFVRSPQRLATIGGVGGLAMIGIGTRLAFTGRND